MLRTVKSDLLFTITLQVILKSKRQIQSTALETLLSLEIGNYPGLVFD